LGIKDQEPYRMLYIFKWILGRKRAPATVHIGHINYPKSLPYRHDFEDIFVLFLIQKNQVQGTKGIIMLILNNI
jgi:hypothetical protein